METFIGSILWLAFTWAPVGTLPADGQCIRISQNQALYSLLGNRYGGNGIDNFCLPDLRPTLPNGQRDPNWNNGPRAVIIVNGIYPSRP